MGFIEDLKKPFNLITFLLAVIGIGLSVVFYYKSEKKKSISYYVNESSSLIFDSKNSLSAIKIYDKNSQPIKENVYLINGIIWNDGDFPITKSDIRIPIHLTLNDQSAILDYKITKENQKESSKFVLSNKQSNSLNLDWKYFDPKAGFKFQIIYKSKNPSKLELKGKILDIDNFENIKNLNPDVYGSILMIFCVAIGFITSFTISFIYEKFLKIDKKTKLTTIGKNFITISLIIILIYFGIPILKSFMNSVPSF